MKHCKKTTWKWMQIFQSWISFDMDATFKMSLIEAPKDAEEKRKMIMDVLKELIDKTDKLRVPYTKYSHCVIKSFFTKLNFEIIKPHSIMFITG